MTCIVPHYCACILYLFKILPISQVIPGSRYACLSAEERLLSRPRVSHTHHPLSQVMLLLLIIIGTPYFWREVLGTLSAASRNCHRQILMISIYRRDIAMPRIADASFDYFLEKPAPLITPDLWRKRDNHLRLLIEDSLRASRAQTGFMLWLSLSRLAKLLATLLFLSQYCSTMPTNMVKLPDLISGRKIHSIITASQKIMPPAGLPCVRSSPPSALGRVRWLNTILMPPDDKAIISRYRLIYFLDFKLDFKHDMMV